MTYRKRLVREVQIPLASGVSILGVENTVVKFAAGQTVDMGAWCYLRRSATVRKKGAGVLVDLTSFESDRASQVLALLCQASKSMLCGLRPMSAYTRLARFKTFIDWCDRSGHVNVLRDIESCHAALRKYVALTREAVDQHQVANNTAALQQKLIVSVLEEYFATDDLTRGINLLTSIRELVNKTAVPGDDEQSRTLAWAQAIFEGLSHLVVDREKDGGLVKLPIFLQLPNLPDKTRRASWVFPLNNRNWTGKATDQLYSAYDFQTGRIRPIEELLELFPNRAKDDLQTAARDAHNVLRGSNENSHHWFRLRQGKLAMSAFYLMFMAATGQNQAQVLEIPWSDELSRNLGTPSNERQGFRQIKYRAQGRLISFEIGVQFVPQLRRYLQLREYLLSGNRCDLLFFRWSGPVAANRQAVFSPAVSPLAHFYRSLDHFSHELPNLQTRQLRAAKDNFVIRRTGDAALSATIAQHSLATALKSYNNGDAVTHQHEMGSYLGQMEKHAQRKGGNSSENARRALGRCTSPGMPVPAISNYPVPVDCSKAEGCLFCDKFRIHADEEDVRKLISARHCIQITGRYCQSLEERELVMGAILKRIELVLAEIRVVDYGLVAKIEADVDVRGELDEFWAAKLETLTALGMELM